MKKKSGKAFCGWEKPFIHYADDPHRRKREDMLLELQKGIIYGPVHSRRLGLSLGINVLPGNVKICPFNCIYCQYGWTKIHQAKIKSENFPLPAARVVKEALRAALETMVQRVSYITFSGNGEPTLHHDFGQIVEEVIGLRDRLAPWAKTAILSNSALVSDEKTRKSLSRLDLRIMKLDCGSSEVFVKYNQPCPGINLEAITGGLVKLSRMASVAIQTLFSVGKNGNFTTQNISLWIERLKRIRPSSVQVYTLDREAPAPNLRPATKEELLSIKCEAKKQGISVDIF